MSSNKKKSGGLAFIEAAVNAMPQSVGDRERIATLCELMHTAVKCRFQFDKEDGESLIRLRDRCQYGVFRPLDFYTPACIAGGTYARMWEAHHGWKPWYANRAVIPDRSGYKSPTEVRVNHRVANGIGVLVDALDPQGVTDLPRHENAQVWWCTSMSNDTIVLCRYRLKGDHPWCQKNGSPAKRMKLTREEWAKLNPKVAKEALA